MNENDLPLWPNQVRALQAIPDAIAAGQRSICVTSPTGTGKTRIECELIRGWIKEELRTVIYTNRKMLVDQLQRVMRKAEINYGVRAAGHEDERYKMVQISSLPTEHARLKKAKAKDDFFWELHDAARVLIDEAHLSKAAMAKNIIDEHLRAGAVNIGVTATPIDIGHIYDHLIVAGTNSEGRACGSLVRAEHYGCDEPDCRKIRKQVWEFTEKDVHKVMMVPGIFGRVLEWFKRLNPDQRPSLCFAPGVPESIWFAEQFQAAGIKAAHIDGKNCWIDGELHPSTPGIRQQIADASKAGDVKVVLNRFVLREGVDWPWLSHGIFATVFTTISSYLQSAGRLLRACAGKTHTTLQDHGGHWWKPGFGSVNIDRNWPLIWKQNEEIIQGTAKELYMDEKNEGRDTEPIRCPKCGIILNGYKCLKCGFHFDTKTRPVFQENGSLRMHEGDIFVPRQTRMHANTQELWQKMYHRARKSRNEMNFNQARGLFFYENHYYPPEDIAYMPKEPLTWYRKVKDVPDSDLTYTIAPAEKHQEQKPSLFQDSEHI